MFLSLLKCKRMTPNPDTFDTDKFPKMMSSILRKFDPMTFQCFLGFFVINATWGLVKQATGILNGERKRLHWRDAFHKHTFTTCMHTKLSLASSVSAVI